MSKDIAKILDGWEYRPDEVIVRIVPGEDGRDKIQLRIDLGLMQMDLDGRPDGTRPEGCESWLDFYLEKQRLHEATHPDSVPFRLTDDDCLRLWREGIQYYHRYLSLWHLRKYDLCSRDTERTLRLFTFVKGHAQGDRNKLQFEQWRPYVTMMHARSVATPLLDRREYIEALTVIDAGIDAIRDFLEEYNQSDGADQCAELVNLERWREEVVAQGEEAAGSTSAGAMLLLRRKLQEAVAQERFEEAARLRDEIRRLSVAGET
jgi:hypothetical protein